MSSRIILAIVAGLIVSAPALPAFAEKPAHAGNPGKGGPPPGKGNVGAGDVRIVIGDGDRDIIRRYYGDQFRAGNCPPGLAKKHNGCMPPGQAKKWAVGRPLPRDVPWYDLPRDLSIRLRPPGDGYRYVRTGADILLIATGTMMVIDAIQDLNRL